MAVNVDLHLDERFNQSRMDRVRYALANQVMNDMDQFVPYRNGKLSQSAHVNSNGTEITYTTPYARAQFYGFAGGKYRIRNYTNTTHPRASRRWDLRAKANYGDTWSKIVAKNI